MARKSRKQTAAPMPAPSLYVHVALYIRLSVEDNKKRGCSVENQKLVLNDFLSDKPDFVVYLYRQRGDRDKFSPPWISANAI